MSNESSPQRARPRTSKPERTQVEMQLLSLDQMLPQDHRARVVWAYVNSLDLSAAYEKIQAVEGQAGRDAVDPKILMCLWMMATIEGISSARRLAELTGRDIPYMWICGGVGVNHHLLSDFRTQHVEMLDRILTNSIATLIGRNHGATEFGSLTSETRRPLLPWISWFWLFLRRVPIRPVRVDHTKLQHTTGESTAQLFDRGHRTLTQRSGTQCNGTRTRFWWRIEEMTFHQ